MTHEANVVITHGRGVAERRVRCLRRAVACGRIRDPFWRATAQKRIETLDLAIQGNFREQREDRKRTIAELAVDAHLYLDAAAASARAKNADRILEAALWSIRESVQAMCANFKRVQDINETLGVR